MINEFDTNKCFHYENGFYLTSEPYRLGNILAHYEIYKQIIKLPGDVIELGVFKGSSLIQFCTFRELLENEYSRKIIGFDIFGSFPETKFCKSDQDFVSKWNKTFKNEFLSAEEIYKSFGHKGIKNVELIQGDIKNTVKDYIEKFPCTKISLLHIDTDVYEPTKVGLELLFDRIVEGGILLLDDYGVIEGETIAVDEFFKDKSYIINKFSFSHKKPSYICKTKNNLKICRL